MDMSRRTLLVGALGAAVTPRAGGRARPEVVEFRQYTLHRDQRDVLIELFEREFLAPIERSGAQVLGTFRDVDDVDRFVWLRGFDSMSDRARALAEFYDGPVWARHRAAANATMLDSDNVLLLRTLDWTPTGAPAPESLVVTYVHSLGVTPPAAFRAFYDAEWWPRLAAAGAARLATLCSEPTPNNYPRLPVRGGPPVFVVVVRWPDPSAEDAARLRLSRCSGWRDRAPEDVLPALVAKPERIRLTPTASSNLR
jgi:hypothetical protein